MVADNNQLREKALKDSSFYGPAQRYLHDSLAESLAKVNAVRNGTTPTQPIPLPTGKTIEKVPAITALAQYAIGVDKEMAKAKASDEQTIANIHKMLTYWDLQPQENKNIFLGQVQEFTKILSDKDRQPFLQAIDAAKQPNPSQADLARLDKKISGLFYELREVSQNRFEHNIDLYMGKVPNRPFSPKEVTGLDASELKQQLAAEQEIADEKYDQMLKYSTYSDMPSIPSNPYLGKVNELKAQLARVDEATARELALENFESNLITRVGISGGLTIIGGPLTRGVVGVGSKLAAPIASKAAAVVPETVVFTKEVIKEVLVLETPNLQAAAKATAAAVGKVPLVGKVLANPGPLLGNLASHGVVEGGTDIGLSHFLLVSQAFDPATYGLPQPKIDAEEIGEMAREKISQGSYAFKAGEWLAGADQTIANTAPLVVAGKAMPSLCISAEDLEKNLGYAAKAPLEGHPERRQAYENNRVLGATLAAEETVAKLAENKTSYEHALRDAHASQAAAAHPLDLKPTNNHAITTGNTR